MRSGNASRQLSSRLAFLLWFPAATRQATFKSRNTKRPAATQPVQVEHGGINTGIEKGKGDLDKGLEE